jgi:hypothetical protein
MKNAAGSLQFSLAFPDNRAYMLEKQSGSCVFAPERTG